MSIAAGNLNRRIRIEYKVAGVGPAGQPLVTWLPLIDLWCNIKGQTGMGALSQSLPQDGVGMAMSSYSFRIRYNPSVIDTAMRVSLDGVKFDILQVRHDYERHDWTDLICHTGAPA